MAEWSPTSWCHNKPLCGRLWTALSRLLLYCECAEVCTSIWSYRTSVLKRSVNHMALWGESSVQNLFTDNMRSFEYLRRSLIWKLKKKKTTPSRLALLFRIIHVQPCQPYDEVVLDTWRNWALETDLRFKLSQWGCWNNTPLLFISHINLWLLVTYTRIQHMGFPMMKSQCLVQVRFWMPVAHKDRRKGQEKDRLKVINIHIVSNVSISNMVELFVFFLSIEELKPIPCFFLLVSPQGSHGAAIVRTLRHTCKIFQTLDDEMSKESSISR